MQATLSDALSDGVEESYIWCVAYNQHTTRDLACKPVLLTLRSARTPASSSRHIRLSHELPCTDVKV